jgi:hypothetical protein
VIGDLLAKVFGWVKPKFGYKKPAAKRESLSQYTFTANLGQFQPLHRANFRQQSAPLALTLWSNSALGNINVPSAVHITQDYRRMTPVATGL